MTAVVPEPARSPGDQAEWRLRCDLAAVFRTAVRLGWGDGHGDCVSVLLPGEHPRFLTNPRDMLFRELTASALIVCDRDGNLLRGTGRPPVGLAAHARLHLAHPSATCIVRVQPRYLTALSLIDGGRMALAHHNNLRLNDRVVYDDDASERSEAAAEGDRMARLLGGKTVLLTAHRGVTVVGPTIHEAFGECATSERTTMYQLTGMSVGGALRALPERGRVGHTGPWGKIAEPRLLLDAWRRMLDREEPDYAT